MIFITHRIDEVFEICDNVTILKDGKLVGEFPVKDLTVLKEYYRNSGTNLPQLPHSK